MAHRRSSAQAAERPWNRVASTMAMMIFYSNNMIFIETICRVAHFSIAVMMRGLRAEESHEQSGL